MQSFSNIKTAITNKAEKLLDKEDVQDLIKYRSSFGYRRKGNLTGDCFTCESSPVHVANYDTPCSFSNFLCLYQERKGKV